MGRDRPRNWDGLTGRSPVLYDIEFSYVVRKIRTTRGRAHFIGSSQRQRTGCPHDVAVLQIAEAAKPWTEDDR
jgi:hypothetical protein